MIKGKNFSGGLDGASCQFYINGEGEIAVANIYI